MSARPIVLLFLAGWWWPAATPAAQTPPPLMELRMAGSLSQSELSADIEQQLRLAYHQLGYQLSISRLPAGRSLQMSNQGLFDGELFRIDDISKSYANLHQVPVALARIEVHAYVRTEQADKLAGWPGQKQLRIGTVRGFRLANAVSFSGYPVQLTTLAQAVEMLRQDKIDVLLEDQLSILSLLGGSLHDSGLVQLPDVLACAQLYHYVHQKHQSLLPALTKALQQQRRPSVRCKKNP